MRSAKALAVAVAAALCIAVIMVKLSPYIPPTPEILARTKPNLFDLLPAVLSGSPGRPGRQERPPGPTARPGGR
jgi:uncharacterized membrane protein